VEFDARMTAQTIASAGTADKYMGDAIFALYGVPLAGLNDTRNALEHADSMVGAIVKWNFERTIKGKEPLAIGIGHNYGPAVLSDVGGPACRSQ